MKSFKTYITESVNKGKEVANFEYEIGKEKLKLTINHISNEYRLNIEGADKFLTKLPDASVEKAKEELKKIVDKAGEKRFLEVINKNKEDVEVKKNDTDWEIFSEYNTSRGSMAFIVYRRISNGKVLWNQAPRGKKYLSIHMTSKENDVKEEIRDTVKKGKLKYVSGWNPETDK